MLLAQRGRHLGAALAGGAASLAIGGSWYIAHRDESDGRFGSHSDEAGLDDGVVMMTARATRYAVESFELPGAPGKDALLYVAVAALVVVSGSRPGRGRIAIVTGVARRASGGSDRRRGRAPACVLQGVELLGNHDAAGLRDVRDATLASNLQSWYGQSVVALTVVATVLAARAVARHTLPWVAVACAVAPVVFLIAAAITTGYNPFTGRFVMGSVALSAATWGIVRRVACRRHGVVVGRRRDDAAVARELCREAHGHRPAEGHTSAVDLATAP